MRTNIEIDDKLMKQAMKASGLPTKKATVEEALKRLVESQRQARALRDMYGKYPDIGDDYKMMR
jgi:Arc/MetJ family transcription regulator